MSQQNVEAFNRAFDAFNRRDVEAMLEELDPGRIRTRGKASGGETESPIGSAVEYNNGKGFGFGPTSTPERPSKPPGCGSRPSLIRGPGPGSCSAW